MINDFSLIKAELESFNKQLNESLTTSVNEYKTVLEYIFNTKGKQIRPIIGILLAKTIGDFNSNQCKFLQAIEIIHNATLFHDDVIDDSDIRRGVPALHQKFSNKMAILTGDYFLSSALKIIFEINNPEINSLLATYIKNICEGEIEQNLTLNQIPSIEKYLRKTKNKTALLFEFTTYSIAILSKNCEHKEQLKDFGVNFGMFFQINDDLKNFSKQDNKPILNDLKSGVITAPIIFLAEEYDNIQQLIDNENYDEIISLLGKSNAIEKTKQLMKSYLNNCKNILKTLPDNEFSGLLANLLDNAV